MVTVLPLIVVLATAIVSTVLPPVVRFIRMFPVPAFTASLNVSTILAPTATPVASSAGVLELRIGAVMSGVGAGAGAGAGAGVGVGTGTGTTGVLSSITVILELTMSLIPSVTTSRSSTRIFLETVRTACPALLTVTLPRVTTTLFPATMREVLIKTVLPLRLSARSTRMRVLPLASLITLVVLVAADAVLAVGVPKAAPVPTVEKPKAPRLSAVPRASALEAVDVDFFFLDILVPPKEIVINGQVRPVISVFSQG
jgi:hypothetical protein